MVTIDEDVITNDQYDALDEGAKRAFKRNGTTLSHYFRCTTGPKAGKLASDPSKCGQRPDPKKVRHGRKVAKLKGSIRVRKTQIKKKTELSKRISRLNKQLMGHNNNNARANESFANYHGLSQLIEHTLLIFEFVYEDLYEQVATQLIGGKYDDVLLEQFIASEGHIGFDQSEPVAEFIVENIELE